MSAGSQSGYTGSQSGYGSGNQPGYGGNQVDYPQQGHHHQGQHGSHGSSGPAQSVGMANQEGGMDRQLGSHHQPHGHQHQQQQQPGGYQWGQGLGSGFGSGFHDSRQVSFAASHLHCDCCGEVNNTAASACGIVHTHASLVILHLQCKMLLVFCKPFIPYTSSSGSTT